MRAKRIKRPAVEYSFRILHANVHIYIYTDLLPFAETDLMCFPQWSFSVNCTAIGTLRWYLSLGFGCDERRLDWLIDGSSGSVMH